MDAVSAAPEMDAVSAAPERDAVSAPHSAPATSAEAAPSAEAAAATATTPPVAADAAPSDDDIPLTRVHNPWRERFALRLWITDLLVLVWVVYGTQIFWFGWGRDALGFDIPLETSAYTALSLAVILVWMAALGLIDSRSDRVVGYGMGEYVKVADASLRVFGAIAIIAFLLRIDVARGYLLIALPAGIVFLVLARWIWRQWLIAQRAMGQYTAKVLLVGSRASVAHIAAELRRSPQAGYRVVGACVPTGRVAEFIEGTDIPIMGNVASVERAVLVTGADTVAITSTDDLPPNKVKEISWALEAGEQHLVLAPGINDIAGPRIHARPVAGLPLLHVETPRFSSGQRFVKRSFDLFGSAGLVVLLSPLLLIVAVLVKVTSPGPVLFRHERIGRHGEPFGMLKFRSMRDGAEAELEALLEEQGTSTTPLFKIKADPRVTPIGRFLRKYSLDELPQLFNVFAGTMSLVGPRPQIAAEVALYTDAARRRLLARPGITGLWQVSGRSTTTWEEAVRLDLYYVENWSLVGDIAILVRTVKAVVTPGDSAH